MGYDFDQLCRRADDLAKQERIRENDFLEAIARLIGAKAYLQKSAATVDE